MKIRPVGAELIHADGRTDKTKLPVALRNFCETRLKNCISDELHPLCFYVIQNISHRKVHTVPQ